MKQLVIGVIAIMMANSAQAASTEKMETPPWPAEPPAKWLTYHLVHPGPGNAMPGDPNPAFYYKGRYHLHYIYKNDTGFVFGHVSSTDMVHWKWHPTVLGPKTTGHGMYSGTGFFTADGRPAMVYHGAGSNRNWIMYGLDDDLNQWSQPQLMLPKDKDGQLMEDQAYFDPDIWRDGETYYGLNGVSWKEPPQIMKSNNLTDWTFLGELLHPDFDEDKLGVKRSEDISCPNMFTLGDKWVLLCISHRLGCRYFIGDFKDEQYLPEHHSMMSWNGNHYFAPESFLTKDKRRVMLAWLMNLPLSPTGVQSLPRELELPKDGVLRIAPLRELEKLRYDKNCEQNIAVKANGTFAIEGVSSDAYELELKIDAPAAKEFGVDVLCDANGNAGLRIGVNAESKALQVGTVNAPFELAEGEELELRVFIDKNLVEVFANGRQAALSALETFTAEHVYARLFTVGSDLHVDTVTTWKMKTIYDGDVVFTDD